jgi:N-acetylglucosamine malate deacetylase 1
LQEVVKPLHHGGIEILAFGPHPDDVEIGAAATLAKACAGGARVVICDLTAGEMGTNGDVATRAAEGAAAARVIGAEARICLNLPDSGLNDAANGADLVAGVIRRLRPRLVIAPWGEDRHPDHRDGYAMVRRAIFLAGLAKHQPPALDGILEGPAPAEVDPFRPELVFYYLINSPTLPQVLVDVSGYYQHKRRALAAFDSQFGWRGQPSPTALNDGIYLPGVEGRDASFGRHAGVAFAEGFIGERFPCLGSLLDVKTCR